MALKKAEELSETVRDGFSKSHENLDAVKQAIAGEGDSSLATQMQKLRDENREGYNKLDGLSETIRDVLIKNLENLIQEMHDVIGKQLGDSLQALIANIEKALIEQFGKTFVEFNAATQALKKWQKDHRQQVEQLTAAFDKTAQGIEKINAECAHIPQTMDSLRPIIETANLQIADLTARLEAFAEMKQQATEGFPEIKANLDKIGADLRSSAEGFDGLEQMIRNSQKDAEKSVREIAKSHAENVEQTASDMRTTMESAQQAAADKIAGVIEAAIKRYAEETSKQLDEIAMQWGSNLVSIAERCADAIEEVNRQHGDDGGKQ